MANTRRRFRKWVQVVRETAVKKIVERVVEGILVLMLLIAGLVYGRFREHRPVITGQPQIIGLQDDDGRQRSLAAGSTGGAGRLNEGAQTRANISVSANDSNVVALNLQQSRGNKIAIYRSSPHSIPVGPRRFETHPQAMSTQAPQAPRVPVRGAPPYELAPAVPEGSSLAGRNDASASRLGGSVSDSRRALSLDLSLDRGSSAVYRAGDEMRIGLNASKDCYVVVCNIDAVGRVTQLFPNAYQRDNRLVAGQQTILSPPEAPWQLAVTDTEPGTETIRAIASRKPLQLALPADFAKSPFPILSEAGWASYFSKGVEPRLRSLADGEWTSAVAHFRLAGPQAARHDTVSDSR